MNLGYKLPQRLTNHTFSEQISFPLRLKCPLICLIDVDLCAVGGRGGATFASSCQSPKGPWKQLSLMPFNKCPQIKVGTGVHKYLCISGITDRGAWDLQRINKTSKQWVGLIENNWRWRLAMSKICSARWQAAVGTQRWLITHRAPYFSRSQFYPVK